MTAVRASAKAPQDPALAYLLGRPQTALEELRAEAVKRQYRKHYAEVPWAMWLIECLPKSFLDRQQFIPFAPYHQEFWEWVFAIPKDEAPKPFIAVWSRDTGKSSAAEAACVHLGAMGIRKYGLYVCHEVGTPIYDPSRPEAGWHPVEQHPSARQVRSAGLSISVPCLQPSIPEEVVTPDHRYYAYQGDGEPQWIEARYLDRQTWIGYPARGAPDRLGADPHAGPKRHLTGDDAVLVSQGYCWCRVGGIKPVTKVMACPITTHTGVYLTAYGCSHNCSAQAQADDHVANVAALLESPEIRRRYPELTERSLNKYGQSKGWRVNRLRTKAGFTLDAIGLDRAVRGARLEEQRPDALVLDDLDSEQDTPRIVERKMQLLTRSLLPAGDRRRLAVLYVQNIPHDDAIMARILDKRTDLLSDAVISGPHPALLGMRYETQDGRVVITHGTPTWQGFTLAHCQNWVQRYTLRAFLAECQHERGRRTGAQWKVEELDAHRVDKAPDLRRVVVAVDPAISSSSRGSETGVLVVGEEAQTQGRAHYYAVADHSGHYTVDEWATTAIDLWAYHQADAIVAEANQGGELVADALQQREPNIRVEIVKATRGKFTRAEPVAGLSQEGRLHMVGHLQELEQQLCTPYDPKSTESTFDRMDALVWGVTFLALVRDPYPHYRRNVVGYAPQERERRPVAPTIALARLDAWKTSIARGELVTCDAEEYAVLRALLMAAVEKYSQARDVRAHIADEQLRHLDQRFGRRGKG